MQLVVKKATFASALHRYFSFFLSLIIAVSTLSAISVAPASAISCSSFDSTSSGGYTYLAFKSIGSCIWTVPAGASSIDYMVVAGGGGGASRHSGGGGGGGYIRGTSVSLSNVISLSVTVGNGGAGAPAGTSFGTGTNGLNSTLEKGSGDGFFETQTAIGGGGGDSNATGGSSAGVYGGNPIGSATFGQGNAGAGGNAGGSSVWSGGGGGGAGSAGFAGTTTAGGNGGPGTTWIAAFTSVIATDLKLTSITGNFSGGGGGGITKTSGTANGGNGFSGGGAGGGTGNYSSDGPSGGTGIAGVANTGGGGGGSGLNQGCNACNPAGGNGGSGVVLIRYANPTITYDLNSGSGTAIANSSFTVGSTAVTLPLVGDRTRTGYTFGGWSTTSSGATVGLTYSPTSSLTLYAVWTANVYAITYDLNSGSGTAITNGSFTVGSTTVTLPLVGDRTRTGYTFGGWSTTNSGATVGLTYSPTSALTLYAVWTADVYAITYDLNSGSGTAIANGSFTAGSTAVTLPLVGDRTKTGYTFGGWSTTNSGATVGLTYSPASSLTLYAVWTANTNNAITYNNATATTAQSGGSTTYTTASSVTTIPTTAPLKTGYAFVGWFTASSGGTQVTSGSYTPASPYGAITLYAQWIANPTITALVATSGTAVGGGTTVVITGTNLGTIASFTIGDVTTTNVSVGSATSATFSVGSAVPAGVKNIVLTTSNGSTVTITNAYETCGTSGYFFIFNNTVVGTNYCAGTVVVPTSVTGIALCGFATAIGGNCGTTKGNAITTVSLPTSLRTISRYGFLGSGMTEITLPEGLTSIGDSVFYMGGSYSVVIPTTVTSMEKAFYKSNATSVTFAPGSTGITSITDVFRGMTNMHSLILPDSVKTIAGVNAVATVNTNAFTTITMRGITSIFAGSLPTTLTCIVTSSSNAAVNAYSYASFVTPPLIVTDISSCPQPTISSLSVSAGTITGSTSTVITGTNLINTTGITVGSAATITARTSTTITITTAAGAAGAADVVLTTEAGSITSAGAFTYTSAALTVTYNSQGGTSVTSGSTFVGAKIASAPTPPTRSNYTLSGWSTTSSGSTVTFPYAHGQVANFTLYAQWSAITYAITYNLNSGTGTAIANGSFTAGSTAVTLPLVGDLTRTGYTFGGWSATNNGATVGLTYSPTSSLTLYAVWTANVYAITYDLNSGTGTAIANGSFTAGSTAVTLPLVGDRTKSGYTFGGWSATNSGATVGLTYSATSSLTLYAVWTADTNNAITYDNQGATTAQSGGSSTYTTASSVTTIPTTAPLKTGYVFAGWFTASSSGTQVTSGSYTPTTPFGAITLYGQWTADSNAITYDNQSATTAQSGGSSTYTTASSVTTIPTTAPLKTGYVFAGWFTASSSGTKVTNASYTPATPYGAITLYGQWTADSNAITYDNQSATTSQSGGSSTYTTASSVTTIPTTAPLKTGYTFRGWFTASSSGTQVTNASYTPATPFGAITLYAQWSANTLTTTFNSQDGTVVSDGSTVTGASISSAPISPTKSNYAFAGWGATIGGDAITFPYPHGKTANFTLYAKWTANQYTVTYVYNSANGGNTTTTDSFTTGGTAITLPVPTKNGNTFGGWYSDSDLSLSIGSTYSPTGVSLTLSAYAKWVAINYTVTFVASTATSGAVPTDTGTYNIGNSVTIKGNTGSLVRTGYSFSGWTSASDGSGTVLTSGTTFTTATSNMNFYTKWSANTYTVTYNVNGAAGTPTHTSHSYITAGSTVTLTTVGTMVKSGYDFAGWSATPTGSLLSGGYTTSTDVSIYAIWTIKTFTVTFNKGDATGLSFYNFPTSATGNYGSTFTLNQTIDSTKTISSNLHTFLGWNDGTTIYKAGSSFTLTQGVALEAMWVRVFGVRYAFNGGTAASGESAVDSECLGADSLCTDQQVITSNAAPTRTGYTFAGWTDQSSVSVPTAGSFTVSTSRYLIYANWTAIDYAITYNSNGGSAAPEGLTKKMGESFTLGAAPTRSGYSFSSWSDSNSTFGVGVDYLVRSSAVAMVAQWTAKVYAVTYDWNGGSGSATTDDSFTVGSSAVTLPVVADHVKDGYTFSGWSTSSNGLLLSGGFTPTDNSTLFAIWGAGSYVVTYDASGGSVGSSSATVANGSSTTLPTTSRSNFVFEGWHTASVDGELVGLSGATFQPTLSRTLYAQWTQASIYGISPSALTRIGTTTARNAASARFSSTNSTSSVSVTVPSGSLPDGTKVNFDLVGDFTRAQSVLSGTNSYIISMVVSWLAPDGTVPNAVSGKEISVTIANASINAGASVYAIVSGVATLLGTATENGTVTVLLATDPELVVIATKTSAPTSVSATANGNKQSVVTWSAPSSNGGSTISSYTVTSNGGQTCTSATTSCTVTGLLDATSYTFTVTATNGVGISVASAASSSVATATPPSKPGAPTSVTASAGATRESVVTWTAPVSDGGSTITGYTVSASVGTTCTSATTSCTINGLSDGTTYTFTVTAANAIGTSDASSSASARTADAVVSGGGDSGGTPTSTPTLPVVAPVVTPVVAPAKSNVTVIAPLEVIGARDVKVIAIEVFTSVVGSNTKPPAITIDTPSKEFIADIKIVDGKIVLTPETGFSGKKIVTVTITENGEDRIIQIPLTVLPEVVTKPTITPTSATKSVIKWAESPNANTYTVYLNGKKVCSTSGISCTVSKILGPDSNIEIVSNGGDRTVSDKIAADFKQTNPVAIARVVSATSTKSTLTKTDTNALNGVIAIIRSQGFGTIVISEITTTKRTQTAAAARIAIIKKYIRDKLGAIDVIFQVVPPTSRTIFNNISVKS